MMMKHISESPPPLQAGRSDVPGWFAGALECALAKKPTDRFESASAFRDALASRLPLGLQAPKQENAGDLRASSAWKHAVPRDAVAVAGATPRQDSAAGVARSAREASRSAIDAANAGWRHQPLAHGRPQADPSLPPVPPWMPDSWRDARRQWHRDRQLQGRGRRAEEQLPVEQRIRLFRRRAANNVITVGMLATINLFFSPDFLWFLFPTVGIGIGLLRQLSGLFADGLKFEDIYGPKARARLAAAAEQQRQLNAGTAVADPSALAPADVLAGPHGAVVRRAGEDKHMIREAVAKLGKADRELIPDVLPTVDALAERVGSLALALHRLDEDVRPGTIEDLERRIAAAREQPESREREQRLQLLERQVSTMKDLLSRRDGMVSQMENAALMLQSMRVDLVALRSAGVQSAINDVNHATQEARALSREIANVLDAARQVR
jgi:serine/threonine-protein kinase